MEKRLKEIGEIAASPNDTFFVEPKIDNMNIVPGMSFVWTFPNCTIRVEFKDRPVSHIANVIDDLSAVVNRNFNSRKGVLGVFKE
ncbi:MAG: hypothetical protein ABH824_04300 [Nanoarchaeota archaeon]